MGYSINFINKGDIIIIDGVRFCAKYDFNLVEGHKNLLLKRVGDEPKVHIAQIEKEE